jgi:Fe2+ transport system protein FeoA
MYTQGDIGMAEVRSLNQLRPGETGVIVRVIGEGAFRKRLLEMGFLKGTEVYVEKYAPLADPVEFVLKGYHVSLRREEAENISVEVKSCISS